VATEVFVFDFELFIGVRFFLAHSLDNDLLMAEFTCDVIVEDGDETLVKDGSILEWVAYVTDPRT